MKKVFILAAFNLFCMAAQAQGKKGFQLIEKKDKQQVDVQYNGQLLTAYCYYDSIKKPFLFPVNTVDGITVTRGYPLQPLPGEITDHPHHTGLWMNYESVNGLDFWNNSTAIPAEKSALYGTIKHAAITEKKESANNASLKATATWVTPAGKVLVNETTTYNFSVAGKAFIIDRTSVLKAADEPVVFKDVKDGFFAIRVARELEMPSQQADVFVDVHGNKTDVPKIDNNGISGMYHSSNGLKGDSVWSSKGPWTVLTGTKGGKDISIGIFDHPTNVGYPSYWHARGYGLFAINPLGRNIFSNGKEALNFTLQPNTATTFRYRVVIASGTKLNDAAMQQMARQFAKMQ